MARRVAEERRVRRALEIRLAVDAHIIGAVVGTVAGRALALVTRPAQLERVMMLFASGHGCFVSIEDEQVDSQTGSRESSCRQTVFTSDGRVRPPQARGGETGRTGLCRGN